MILKRAYYQLFRIICCWGMMAEEHDHLFSWSVPAISDRNHNYFYPSFEATGKGAKHKRSDVMCESRMGLAGCMTLDRLKPVRGASSRAHLIRRGYTGRTTCWPWHVTVEQTKCVVLAFPVIPKRSLCPNQITSQTLSEMLLSNGFHKSYGYYAGYEWKNISSDRWNCLMSLHSLLEACCRQILPPIPVARHRGHQTHPTCQNTWNNNIRKHQHNVYVFHQ